MAAGVSAFIITSAGRASPKMVLKMYKAKALGPRDLPQLQEMFDSLVERADLEHKPTLYYVPSKCSTPLPADGAVKPLSPLRMVFWIK